MLRFCICLDFGFDNVEFSQSLAMTDIKSKKDEQNWAVFQDLEYEFKPVRAEILAIHSRPNLHQSLP